MSPIRLPATGRQIVKSNQECLVPLAVSGDGQQFLDAGKSGLTREIVRNVALPNRLDRVDDNLALVHAVTTADFHVRARPDPDRASDSTAPDPFAKVFGE